MKTNHLIGKADVRDFSSEIAWDDHSLGFYRRYCVDKDVLDVGCVMHNPENYQSRFWVHKALKQISKSLIGIDLHEEGVKFLRAKGFDVRFCDAQDFHFDEKFDVIVAGNIIEHLENLSGFIKCCKAQLRPHGVILISTPNPWYWRLILKAALGREVNNNPEHTMWLCPRTLRQLFKRHHMDVRTIEFGSRYIVDRLMPLPKGWKHTTFNAAIIASSMP
jgi:2-polyprenyl-3-methyl-5-hydroxy-6-metoxy-1,4-benzoquinol methylase